MNDSTTVRTGTMRTGTMYTGPLGSTIHVLRADAGTIAELAAIDWNRYFRRVCLDPVRGLITLMTPSHPHEDLATILDDIVDAAGSVLAGARKGLRSLRLRGPGEPPGTGMEPDCAFYVGERAKGYYAARGEGKAAVEAFVERTAPDLVVEVEITHADEGKAERYGEIGVRELWRLHGRKDSWELRADFLALHPRSAPRKLDASQVLEGLTPGDVCEAEALEEAQSSQTRDECTEAVARIVRRRQQASARPWKRRSPARHAMSARRRWPGSYAGGSRRARGCERRRRRTSRLPRLPRVPGTETAGLRSRIRTICPTRRVA